MMLLNCLTKKVNNPFLSIGKNLKNIQLFTLIYNNVIAFVSY